MIKLVTFNVLCSDNKAGMTIADRAPLVKKTLDALDADVIGLQEVTEKWVPYIEEYYGADYEFFNKWRKSTNHESTPILWKKDRFECLEKGWFWLSDTPTVEYGEPWDDKFHCTRICMWVKLWDKKDGVSFTFFNTHYGFGRDCQARSSAMILSYMKAIGGPCFVTADFNMGAGTPGYIKFTERLVDANVATVNDPRSTFNGLRDEPFDCKPGDLCFITPETITPITSKLIHEKVDGKFASDHYAVYFELEIHESLKMMSLNVNVGGKEQQAIQLRRLIRSEQADVVGLQECNPYHEEELKKLANYEMALKYRSVNQSEGTPILWRNDRFDLVHEEHFWLSDTPEVEGKGWDGAYIRIATLVVLQYKNTDRKICVLNTHFDFAEQHHLRSVALIKERLAPYADLPILISGDFNMFVNSGGYQAITEQFSDVRRVVAPTDQTPTTNCFGKWVQNNIIDYVFTNGQGIVPQGYQVINTKTKDGYISDHNGLRTIFVLKQGEEA